MTVRPASQADLPAIAAIQAANPLAAQWDPAAYLSRETHVAEQDGRILGFLVLLPLGQDEAEILNIAVEPASQRRGVARALLLHAAARSLFLEVRASNAAARAFYLSLGFAETGRRRLYYANPPEDAILLSRLNPSHPA